DRGRVRHAQRCQEGREEDHGRRGLTLWRSPTNRSLALSRDESAEAKNGLTTPPPALTQEAGLGGLTCGLCNLGPGLAPHVLRGSERSARLSVHTLDRVIGSPTRRSRRSSSTSATGSTTWWSTRPAMTSGAF